MKYVKQIGTHTLAFILGAIIFGGIGITIAADIQSNTVLYETEANVRSTNSAVKISPV